MKNIIWVGFGGMVGTVLRFAASVLFPTTGLWIVNVIGSFVLGLIFHQIRY